MPQKFLSRLVPRTFSVPYLSVWLISVLAVLFFVLLMNQMAIAGDPGTKKWSFETGDKISSSPAIGSDGTIYVGSWDNN